MRSEGEMPIAEYVPVPGTDVRRVLQEEGDRQTKQTNKAGKRNLGNWAQDDLERAVEKEVFLQLKQVPDCGKPLKQD